MKKCDDDNGNFTQTVNSKMISVVSLLAISCTDNTVKKCHFLIRLSPPIPNPTSWQQMEKEAKYFYLI